MRYVTSGVCSRYIDVEVEGDVIKQVYIHGGCSGNTQGICALVKGRNIDEVIALLQGTRCGFRPTSCPDQLAKALIAVKNERNN